MYKITNWENDMIDAPEEMVAQFVKEKYPEYEFQLLSGLKHRDIQDIYDSLRDSRVIIMQPSLFDKEQVVKIVQAISHPIHVNNNGAQRNYDIRDFVFLSANPFEDLTEISTMCYGVKDQHGEESLPKILYNCECHFYGFAGEHYELKRYRSDYKSHYAIRHS